MQKRCCWLQQFLSSTSLMLPGISGPCFNIYQANGYQYWPAWMLYGLQNANFTPINSLPLNFISLDSSVPQQESTCPEKQTLPSSPKLGFTEFRPKARSETTQCQETSKNSREDDLSSDNGESSFICKKNKKISKKTKCKRGPQNKNRNITPSLVQQIFSFLSKPNKSMAVCQRVFNSLAKPDGCELSPSRYYYFIKQIKEKLNHYVNEKSLSVLCQVQEIGIGLFSASQQQFYLRMARVLAKHFLDSILPYLILHSKRMFEDKRVQHLRIRRTLLQVLEGLEC